jgi:hypothetical protein
MQANSASLRSWQLANMLNTKHKFSDTRGMNKLPFAKRAQILTLLCEGSSMRSIERIVRCSINTVDKLLRDAGEVALAYHDEHVRGVKSQRVQCDEIWSFVAVKQKNRAISKHAANPTAGDCWTWTAIDADHKIRTSQLRRQEECRDAFYRYADRLASDPETPVEALKLLQVLLHEMPSRRLLWSFVADLAKGKIRGRRSASLEIYKKIPQRLRADYVGLLVSFIFALTYNNIALGSFVRRFILYSIPNTNDGDIGPVSPVGPMIDGFARHQPSAAH